MSKNRMLVYLNIECSKININAKFTAFRGYHDNRYISKAIIYLNYDTSNYVINLSDM